MCFASTSQEHFGTTVTIIKMFMHLEWRHSDYIAA